MSKQVVVLLFCATVAIAISATVDEQDAKLMLATTPGVNWDYFPCEDTYVAKRSNAFRRIGVTKLVEAAGSEVSEVDILILMKVLNEKLANFDFALWEITEKHFSLCNKKSEYPNCLEQRAIWARKALEAENTMKDDFCKKATSLKVENCSSGFNGFDEDATYEISAVLRCEAKCVTPSQLSLPICQSRVPRPV